MTTPHPSDWDTAQEVYDAAQGDAYAAGPDHEIAEPTGDEYTAEGIADEARGVARELLAAVTCCGVEDLLGSALLARIRTDPALFWLRGEEAPAGQWTPPEGRP